MANFQPPSLWDKCPFHWTVYGPTPITKVSRKHAAPLALNAGRYIQNCSYAQEPAHPVIPDKCSYAACRSGTQRVSVSKANTQFAAHGAKYLWIPDRRSTPVSLVRNDGGIRRFTDEVSQKRFEGDEICVPTLPIRLFSPPTEDLKVTSPFFITPPDLP